MPTWTVLYDAACGFCRCSVRALLRLDRRRALRPVAIQSPEGDELLSAVATRARLESWHLRSPDGRVYSAGAAVPPLLRLLPGGRYVAPIAERFPRAVEASYGLVSRHRGRLGRWLRRPCRASSRGA